VAEEDRTASASEVARACQRGLALRLQLRGLQLAPLAETDPERTAEGLRPQYA
jgi:hypothetical protein